MAVVRTHRTGFTIVEVLVVVGVIAALVGLLLPALGGARRRASKANEVNRIRQIGIAWNMYAQSNNDAALPGFLSSRAGPEGDTVHRRWRLTGKYRFPDKAVVPDGETEEWTWRLLPYLDYDQDAVMGHLDLPRLSELERKTMGDYAVEDDRTDGTRVPRPVHIAENPGFAYNGYYCGGYWDIWFDHRDVETAARPRYRFHNATRVTGDRNRDGGRVNVVAASASQIVDPTRFVLFVSAAPRTRGEHDSRARAGESGTHLANAPFYGKAEMWRSIDASGLRIDVQSDTHIPTPFVGMPIARHTDQAAIVHGDLHTATMVPGALDDQRYWVNGADSATFQHTN